MFSSGKVTRIVHFVYVFCTNEYIVHLLFSYCYLICFLTLVLRQNSSNAIDIIYW